MLTQNRARFINYLILNYDHKSSFSSCSCLLKNYCAREAKMLKKLLSSKTSKKSNFYPDRGAVKTVQAVIKDPSTQRRTPHRVSILNKLFMTNITDLLATGELCEAILGRGMEVTNVAVSIDYQKLRVFWIAKSREDEEHIEKHLTQLSFALRHELSQLHLMGSVPRILFLLDQRASRLASVNSLILSCDKGPQETFQETETVTSSIPVMTNNVYGLQYSLISTKIVKSMNKAKAPHRKKITSADEPQDDKNLMGNDNFQPNYNQKESIRKFLLHRKLDAQRSKREKYKDYDDRFDNYSEDEKDETYYHQTN